jgi:hypothetical protein
MELACRSENLASCGFWNSEFKNELAAAGRDPDGSAQHCSTLPQCQLTSRQHTMRGDKLKPAASPSGGARGRNFAQNTR